MKRIAPAGPSRSVRAFHPFIRIWYNDMDEERFMGQSVGNHPCGETEFIPNAVLFYVVTATINT